MGALRSWGTHIDGVLIAPGATAGERLLGYGSGVSGAVFAGVLAAHAALPLWAVVVLAAVAFDVFGGVVVNATLLGSRRFHRPDTPRWSALRFVAFHVHPFALAFLLPEQMPWGAATVAYGGIVLATVSVVLTPRSFRQPVAFVSAAILIAVTTSVLQAAAVVGWVLPLLVVKLLLSHLLPHPQGE